MPAGQGAPHDAARATGDDTPWRAAPLGAAQRAEHARQLAARHVLQAASPAGARALHTLLTTNADAIAQSCAALDDAARTGLALPPAGARLQGGQHLLDAQVRLARTQLHPLAASLPALAPDGAVRAWRLVLDAVAHGDGRIDIDELAHFVAAYQESAPLRIAELDALPALLRLALIDNLRRLAARAARACAAHAQAATWAARLQTTAETRPGDLILLVADMMRSRQTGESFVAELARRLHGRGGALTQVLDWIDARLADGGSSIAQQTQHEHSEQAEDAISVGNSLASLRALGGIDWRAFAEAHGAVDALLRTDPDGSYAQMDGATRDSYRHAIARRALAEKIDEADVARAALMSAGTHRAPDEGGLDVRTRHVGHYLAGLTRPARMATRIGASALLTLLLTIAIVVHARQGDAGAWLLVAIGVLALPGASELARALVRLVFTLCWRDLPATTPRMDFSAGIPASCSAIVAVCAQATDAAAITRLRAELEVRYLGNRDPNVRFCLLLDLLDAASEVTPGDDALLAHARGAIESLNLQYGAEDHAPFMLLVRPRSWSIDQQAWIGQERQRGQVADLNAWLCGARDRFLLAAGNTGAAAEVRYVIALDANAGLPRDAARSLVAAMAHPLCQPVQDESGRVREGHGMLLPERGPAPPGHRAPRFSRMWRGAAGTWAESGAGCGAAPDAGQGWAAIIDVDAWRRAGGDTLHDEGRAVPGPVEQDRLRAGRVSDLRVPALHPANYGEHMLRRQRALRAAWQDAHRLGRGPGCLQHAHTRWQLAELLRASLVAPASLALLLLCWSLLAAPVFWMAAVLAVVGVPALLAMLLALGDRPSDAPWRQHLDGWARGARAPLQRTMFWAAFLPHAAWSDADALVRGLWRRHGSRRRVLDIPPAAAGAARALDTNSDVMWFAPLLAVSTAMLLSFANPYALFATAPLLLVWFLSPVLAWWTGQVSRRSVRLAPAQDQFLRALARRSWAFFEQHGAAGHGLAPEAVLEHPEPAIDARVSPDAIGLTLLATLSARDFGFIGMDGLLERSETTFASMALLERWQGHLLHWYDGATLAPLEPQQVDTAASGSLVLALRTFAAGLDEMPDQPVAGAAPAGIRAALLVVREHAHGTSSSFLHALDEMDAALAPERCRALDTLPGLVDCLRLAHANAERLAASVPLDADPALRGWVQRLLEGCAAQLEDVYALAPWMRAVQEYVLDASLTRIPTLNELAQLDAPTNAGNGLADLVEMVDEGRACAHARLARLASLAEQARAAARMDFGALVDPATGQLTAAYHVRDGRMDSDSCDLLAADARMASFAAIAQDQLPQQHWWALGRPLRMAGAGALLLSRRGAMADVLAPQLWMPAWRDTLLDGAARALVRAQASHARDKGVLWGFSESACNAVDAAARYRFGAFGLPAAALQRGDDDDLVAAPYAAALALGVAPGLACANLRALAGQGLLGELGLYDALDYAPARLPQGERQVVVRAYVARHQAMTILALARHLQGEPMQRRFCRDPEFRAALALLQEPLPVSGAAAPLRDGAGAAPDGMAARPYARVIGAEPPALPEVQLLSNGRYHLAVAVDGSGVSRWDDAQLTRTGLGEVGLGCHVRDTASGQVWSSILPLVPPAGAERETIFAEGRVSVRSFEDGIAIHTDVVVAPDDDVELRRIRIVNRGLHARTLELTSSVALAAPPLAEGGRSNVRVELDPATDSLLCLTAADAPVVLHRMTVRDIAPAVTVETERARFIGRGHDLRAPQAIEAGGALPGLVAEPDAPLLALRRSVTLAPQQEITLDLVVGVASSRALARQLATRYGAGHAVDRAIDAAWTQAQAFLRRLDVSEDAAQLYNRLAGCLLQPVPALRADPAVIARNVRDRVDLHACGIDCAQPVLLLQLSEGPDTGLARQVLGAHAYWRGRGFAVDLLVLCDSRAVREHVMGLAVSLVDPDSFDAAGGVHLFLREDVAQEDRILLRSSARVLLLSGRGDLADQLRRAARPGAALPPAFASAPAPQAWTTQALVTVQPERRFDNGIGGFTPDGREYEVRGNAPAPWPNLLANAGFGSVLSERGHAVTWSGARDARLTAGGDDVAPQDGEAFYLRDEDSGAFWSPTPWPAPSSAPYLTRHGVGYTVFEHSNDGIHSALRCFVAPDAPLKYSVLLLRNDSDAPRRLSVTGFVAWQLDAVAATPGLQVVTGIDLASGALFARNAFSDHFRDQVGFFHLDAEGLTTTCDRDEFIGRQGSIARPAALGRTGLSGAAGAGFDPCAALQAPITLAPGAECELVFVLGVAGPGTLDASREVQRHGGIRAANAAWDSLRSWWDATLGAVELRSPDASLDLRVNTWLPYQAISAAWGERCAATRLQALLASVHARPALLQQELLRAAREFAGAPAVDDFLWLPYALTRYLAVTGDQALLTALPFAGESGEATRLAAQDDLYQHCVHGLRGCLRFGKRGLPLAAARLHDDDITGRVESVRMGFFMATVLQRFAEVADRRGDFGFATTCRGAALALKAQCEEHGWDGDWYRWTWLDSSNALGSIANAACRVELSTQGWAVQADAEQGAGALRAAAGRLVDEAQGVTLLCDPAVDGHWSERVAASPGQDHGAVALAASGFARLGDTGRAWQLAAMLDPLARAGAPETGAPLYFLAGGVRTVAPNIGRAIGGIHAASAGATWLLAIEALLGVERNGARLHLTPHLAPGWEGFSLRYRYYSAIYEITVRAGDGMEGLLLDGQPCPDWTFELQDDRRDHRVELWIAGTPAGA